MAPFCNVVMARHDFLKIQTTMIVLTKDLYKNRDAVRNTQELMPWFTWNEYGTEGEARK